MKRIRTAIIEGVFPEYIHEFLKKMYPNKEVPKWAVDALESVNIDMKNYVMQPEKKRKLAPQ